MKSKTLYQHRVQALLKQIKSQCTACIIEEPTDLYYLTGLTLSTGRLLVSSRPTLFVDGRYTEMCQKHSPFPVRPLNTPLEEAVKGTRLGFDAVATSFQTYEKYKKALKKGVALVALDAPVVQLRAVKDVQEIQALKKAALLGSKGYDYACSLLVEGISEEQVAIELEIFWKRHGATGAGFAPIIAFGENSSMPHYRSGARKLRSGDIVLIDIGVALNHYQSDMTRTLFFGKPKPELLAIHKIVQEAQAQALKRCKAGAKIGEIDAAARDYIAAQGHAKHFNHGLGHGVGLAVHELPVLKNIAPYATQKLQKGMVVTIEPGIYLPGIGGVRIEDTVVITEEGYIDLTKRPHGARVV